MADLLAMVLDGRREGRISDVEADKLVDVHLLVTRMITCPVSGRVLDSRRSSLVRIGRDGDETLVVIHEAVADVELSDALADGAKVLERWSPADAWQRIYG